MKTTFTSFLRKVFFAAMALTFMLFFDSSANAQTILTVGTGTTTNTSSSYPAPYGNWYWGARHQFVIQASELAAIGGASGSITSLAFDVETIEGEPLSNFTIKMGTTTDNALSSFVTGLTEVYTIASYTEVAGWNTHTFTTPYQWDGVSNLVIETCFNNSGYTGNALTRYTTTTFNSAVYYKGDNATACTNNTATTSADRPNMQIGILMVPQTNDLAIVSWETPVSPMVPNTVAPVSIKLRNAGIAAVDSFDISYSIDGGATYIVEPYNNTLNAGDTLTYTFTATANLPMGAYSCYAAVNNVGDTIGFNDSLTYTLYSGDPLNGTYTIGTGTSDDFATIGDATIALELFGVTGPVVFNLGAETFDEQVSITGPIIGMSPVNNLMFNGQGASTIITSANSETDDRDIFRINGQSYITLDSITIINAGTTNYSAGIRIMESDSITIKNCTITVPENTSSYTNCILASGSLTSNSTATNVNYLMLDNNTFNNGYYAFRTSASSTSRSTNLIFTNNTLNNYYYYGIYSYYQDSVVIKNNTLENSITASGGNGLSAAYNNLGSVIANNSIISHNTGSGYGLYISYCEGSVANPFMIYNNMIVATQTTSSFYGIYSNYGKNVNYYYNTSVLNSGSTTSRALYVSGTTSATATNFENINFKNNVFANYGSGYAVYLNGAYYPTSVTEMDYNNLYVSDTTYLAKMSSTYTSLSAWQQAAPGLDSNSVNIDPVFISNTDGHVASIPMSNLATPIAGIDGDIDGDSRDLTTPDMGADEYTPPANEVELISYMGVSGSACGLTSSETIKVVVRNNGTANQTAVPVKYILDGGSVVTETIATLNSLAIDTFTFSTTADLSAAGMHNIVAYVDVNGEENRNNDTVFATANTIGSISSFPYYQNFETPVLDFGLISNDESYTVVDSLASNGGALGLHMAGGSGTGWSSYSNVTAAFDNTTHISEFAACDLNATSVTTLNMSFYYKINATYNTTYGWFRVMLNDTVYVKDVNGDSAWNANATGGNDPFSKLVFNLNAFAGSQVTLSLQFAGKYSNENYSSGDYGDEIFIDDLKIYETAPNDLGVTKLLSPVSTICESAAAPVEVVVSNFGLNAETMVPVTVIVTNPLGVNTTISAISQSIALSGIDTILVGNVNTTVPGMYYYIAYATLATDTMYNDNDTLMGSFEIATPLAVDHVETFENLDNWTSGMSYSSTHGLNGNGMYKNFYSGNSVSTQMLQKVGPISAGDNLVFDYQVIDYNNTDSVLLDQDSMFFAISNDCGATYDIIYVVDANVHSGSVEWVHKQFPLTSYIGDNILIAFSGFHGDGSSDLYFNIDNYGVATTPMVTLGADITVCAGDIAMIDAGNTSGYNYMWTYNGDTITSNTTSMFDADSAGVYTVEVSNPLGMAYDTLMVYHNALPMVSFTGLDTAYCASEMPVMLMGTPAGGTYMGIIGESFDPFTAGAGNHVITYSYTDTNGCMNYTTDTTMVNDAPMALVSMGSEICEGESVDISAAPMVAAPSVFFSMYIEGSSNNKGIEIFNGTNATVNLDNYRIAQSSNGGGWAFYHTFPAGATLAPNMGWIMVTNQVDVTLYDTTLADEVLGYPSVVHHNGDDARAIEYTTDGGATWMMIDIIGDPDNDPGSAWEVAGEANATANHSLIRKSNVVGGSLNWTNIAGTDAMSSQYEVLPQNTFAGLGNHMVMPPVPSTDTYLWSNGDTTATITVMPTMNTTYYVTVSNPAMDCNDIDSVTIIVKPLPVVDLGSDVTIKWSNGSINLNAGNVGASYLWSTGETSQIMTYNNTNLTNNSANTISVDVDINGCVASDEIIITMDDDVSIGETFENANVSIYPNPTNGQFDMTIEGVNGNFNMQIVNVTGEVVYSETMNAAAKFTKSFDVSEFAAGVYYIKLSNNDGIVVKKLVVK